MLIHQSIYSESRFFSFGFGNKISEKHETRFLEIVNQQAELAVMP